MALFNGGNIGEAIERTVLKALPANNPPILVPGNELGLRRNNGVSNSRNSLHTEDLPPAVFDGATFQDDKANKFFILKRVGTEEEPQTLEEQGDSGQSLPLLARGSEGEEVRNLQDRLSDLGFYSGEVDGDFGDLTFEAVRRFQEDRGLEVDGLAGSQTLDSLFNSPSNQEPDQEIPPEQFFEDNLNELFDRQISVLSQQQARDLLGWTFESDDPTEQVYSRGDRVYFSNGVFNLEGNPLDEGSERRPSSLTTAFVRSSKLAENFSNPSPDNFSGEPVQVPSELGLTQLNEVGNRMLGRLGLESAPGDLISLGQIPAEEIPPAVAQPLQEIPKEWKFIAAPSSISWSKTGQVNRDNPFGTNKQLAFYTSTSMRTLSMGEVMLEGLTERKSVEQKILALEKCMEIDRNPEGFYAPYVWELVGLGKSYGFYLITSVAVNERLRDDRGQATRATASIELTEVPEFQIYNGRDLARSGDLVKPNFSVCDTGGSSELASTSVNNNGTVNSSSTFSSGDFRGDLDLLKKLEGFEAQSYDDVGEPAIGYGMRSYYDDSGNLVKAPPIGSGVTWTEERAEEELRERFSIEFLPKLEEIPGWDEMSRGQQTALASFAWNIGADFYQPNQEVGGLTYQISRALAERDWDAVPSKLALYRNRGSLDRRRQEEIEYWNRRD